MKYPRLVDWTAGDLAQLPREEDDSHEYKSSKTSTAQLRSKLERAASAFWNSGGGLFVAGVNGSGQPDGGFEPHVGRQSLRDWVDQVVHNVDPVSQYEVVTLGDDGLSLGTIESDKVVLGIQFSQSHMPPHMAPDGRYYVRAGAHSVRANHFLVESLWARRRLSQPELRVMYRLKPEHAATIQVGVVAIGPSPALDVEFSIDPLPEIWSEVNNPFPIHLGMVDTQNPFWMDLVPWHAATEQVGDDVFVRLRYFDIAGRVYDLKHHVEPSRSISPWSIGTPVLQKMSKSLDDISKNVKNLVKQLSR